MAAVRSMLADADLLQSLLSCRLLGLKRTRFAHRELLRVCVGFWTPATREAPHAQLTGVQKAPRHEVAGSWARAGQRVLCGFDVGADLNYGRDAGTTPPACLVAREVGRVQEAVRRALGARRRAIRALMDAIGPSEIAAGAEPAHRNGKAATVTRGLAHDESILFGAGRQLGWQPGANVSMMIMRAPQRGHGHGSTRGVSGATSGGCWGSAAGGTTLRSARAVAMLSARLVEAKSP